MEKTDSFYVVPELINEDIERYKVEAKGFKEGTVHPTKFRAFRVPCGVYEQRTENTFMVRIKVPAGGLTSFQLKRLADLSKEYGNGVLHLTTRQEIQIHWVRLEDPPLVMEKLKEINLTTKGGGGNTVRNIASCFDAGVCASEAFDVTPYAIALSEHMLPDPASYTLPRKFKVAFSGCAKDCSFATVNDMGLIAKIKKVNGKDVKGFSLYMGGGMGAYSRTAELFDEFIPAEDLFYYADALKIFFDRNGNRKSKHKARLRFVLDKLGHEEFKKSVYSIVEQLRKEKELPVKLKNYPHEVKPVSGVQAAGARTEEFEKWVGQNVLPQRDKGYFMVKLRFLLGDIPAADLVKVAELTEQFGEGTVRICQDQDLIVRWVHESRLLPLFEGMKKNGLINSGMSELKDLVCCTGAATCKLGIGLSRGLSTAVFEKLNEADGRYDKIMDVKIRVSGCPNSCGQHPIGQVGFHGLSRRINGHLALFYKVLLGGRTEEGKTQLGKEMGIVPAKNIPVMLKDFFDYYAKEVREKEDCFSFFERAGYVKMKELASKYSDIPSYEENPDYYKDWGAEHDFSLTGLGPGECGAGVFDLIEVDIKDSKERLEAAKTAVTEEAAKLIYASIVSASRALLVTRGAGAENDKEVMEVFNKEFIENNLVDKKFQKLIWLAEEYKAGDVTSNALFKKIGEAEELSNVVSELYKNMDDSLRFNVQPKPAASEKTENAVTSERVMDLRGVLCPFNYVKAKIALETMEQGDKLVLFLDEGEPIQNVPVSLKNDGQDIQDMVKIDEYYRLVVEKKV